MALNSNCSVVSCAAGGAQEQWLRADLAASTRPCTLAYWHHPRFSSGSSHGDNAGVAPLFSALYDDGTEVLLTGHEHNYERFDPQSPTAAADPNGVREFVVGTGGKSLYGFAATPKANSAVRISGQFGVLKLTLTDGAYSWEFVREDATVAEAGSASCR